LQFFVKLKVTIRFVYKKVTLIGSLEAIIQVQNGAADDKQDGRLRQVSRRQHCQGKIFLQPLEKTKCFLLDVGFLAK
jgi:hypothetical protein